MPRFKLIDRDFLFFQINLDEQYEEGTLEHTLNKFIDERVNMKRFEEKYNNDNRGQTALHPSIILKVIIYSYIKGIHSMRKMEQKTKGNLAYKYFTGDRTIDHTTIAKFMTKFREEIEDVFGELLILLDELELIDWSMIFIDGTRISSNASKELTGNDKGFENKIRQYRRLFNKLIERSKGLESMEEEEMKKEEMKRIERQRKRYESVIKKIEEHREQVKSGEIDGKKKVNLTDKESGLLRTKDGFIQGYNVQTMISNNDMIVEIEARGEGQDNKMTEEVVRKVEERKEELGVEEESEYFLDKGYFNSEFISKLEGEGLSINIPIPCGNHVNEIEKFEFKEEDGEIFLMRDGRKIKGRLNKDKEYIFRYRKDGKNKSFSFSRAIVENREILKRYKEKVSSKEWQKKYNKRIGKEHNFDTIKNQLGFRRIHRRGKEKATLEAKIVAIAHNFKKLFQYIINNNISYSIFERA